jgi:predicted nucleic acid-binding protein
MAETQYLVDSNILLRWVKPDDTDYSAAVFAIDAILQRQGVLCYTTQNLAEFWNACTRPSNRNGYGLSPQETDHKAKLLEARLRLLPDSIATHDEWRKIVVAYNVSGVQVYDARLVASMRIHGVKHILTFNDKDFLRYADIQAMHPRAVSRA